MAAGELEHCPRGSPAFLSTRGDADTQLILSSSTEAADLTRMVGFQIFRPQRLIFTKLDETRSFSPILYQAARTPKPLSFFAGGQRIPKDLGIASGIRLDELIPAPGQGTARAMG